jgi:membrane fusion protein, multidrug efflux system
VNDIKSEQAVAGAQPVTQRQSWLSRFKWPLMLAGPVVIALIGGYVVITGARYVSTDDAYIGAARVAVSASVPGRIIAVNARENQQVKKGDVLVVLDDSDYRTAVERAQAELAAAKLQVAALRASYEQSLVGLNNAQATAAYAEREKTRQADLMKAGITSQQDYDRAAHQSDEAEHAVTAAQQEVAKTLADLGGDPDNMKDEDHPRIAQATAQLDRAKIDLAHTKIVAADDGIVTKVEQVQVGSYANTSQPLFWLISNERWVEANFKENQLAKLHPCETASITLDAFPGRKITAKVASFSPGTGSSFALLPAENATGNWVKVAQRLPVRLDIVHSPADIFLASGLSAHVTVDAKSCTTGQPQAAQ